MYWGNTLQHAELNTNQLQEKKRFSAIFPQKNINNKTENKQL